jgi:N-succinyldiaminopimelate aminotransferase
MTGGQAFAHRYAHRATELTGSGLASWLSLSRTYGAVDLAVASPEYPTPPERFIRAGERALRIGNHQYENPIGIATLRAQVAQTFKTPADPETELTITVGATGALSASFLALVDPGDEIVLFEPFYSNYLDAIRLTGGHPRFVSLHPPDWRYDPAELRAAFGSRTRVFLLNNPQNPTGRVFSIEEIQEIGRLCIRWNVYLISDEVYSLFLFGDSVHHSPADLPEFAPISIAVGSLSKSHALSGWRIGFMRAPAELSQTIQRVHTSMTAGTAGPLQHAISDGRLHDGQTNVCTEMQSLRDQAIEMFSRVGLNCNVPEGGACFLAATGESGDAYAHRLVRQNRVAVAPGSLFFNSSELASPYVRISYNKTAETLTLAARRLFSPPQKKSSP